MPSNDYDAVLYDASAHLHTHPTRLATMAYLMGLSPPSVYTARVLEIGCATGMNLLPMAENYPDAEFVGIDYSKAQIETGQARVEQSGLTNIRLEHRSIADITSADGEFDYIIAHGVYSWIPKDMQDALMALSANNLSPHGVVYISYNVLPGWNLSGVVRDMMLYHVRDKTPEERIPQARGILEFLSKHSPEQTPYGQLLRETAGRMATYADYYLEHEYLERENEAILFHEFAARIEPHGLQYLAEVELGSMLPNFVAPEAVKIIAQISKTFIDYEQYLDFLRARSFRQSLLVHKDASIVRQVQPDRIRPLWAFSSFTANMPLDHMTQPGVQVDLTNPNGDVVQSTDALFKWVLRLLVEAIPMTMSVEKLIVAVGRLPEFKKQDVGDRVCVMLAEASGARLVRLLKDPPKSDYAIIDARPIASPVARVESRITSTITVKGHAALAYDFTHLLVIGMLDGTRDHAELLRVLTERHDRKEFKFDDTTDATPRTLIEAQLVGLLEHILGNVRNAGLLRRA